ncbi:hypothetical protein [Streptomyces sp. SM12]|uniref:hypothetical protein n=1 Tax=Streptomyces sp. SM12 TaxID=1071602 RepID=UPI0011B0C009|nr:hypothetical protein [Streptomyces sp. SM12]
MPVAEADGSRTRLIYVCERHRAEFRLQPAGGREIEKAALWAAVHLGLPCGAVALALALAALLRT